VVIYNPVQEPVSLAKPPQQSKKPQIHIWFVGRLVPLKWVDIFIHALAQITNIDRICTIVGTWSHDQTLQTLAQTLSVSDKISFVWADDRANRLPIWDILVNPSHQEWVPTTVVEWLMAGCIVVATDVWW
jgi:glycosyltransferase involved in cell wall biosynthesis